MAPPGGLGPFEPRIVGRRPRRIPGSSRSPMPGQLSCVEVICSVKVVPPRGMPTMKTGSSDSSREESTAFITEELKTSVNRSVSRREASDRRGRGWRHSIRRQREPVDSLATIADPTENHRRFETCLDSNPDAIRSSTMIDCRPPWTSPGVTGCHVEPGRHQADPRPLAREVPMATGRWCPPDFTVRRRSANRFPDSWS